MSDEPIRLGDQSQTTLEPGHGQARDAALALALVKADVTRLVVIEALIPELMGLKTRLDLIEKTLGEIAIGLGVVPK